MNEIVFCIKCGSKTTLELISGDTISRNICNVCDYIHYVNPKIIVGALPLKDDKVLLCKRDINPGKGKWTLPSGFMEMGESLEQGAKREAKEEANLKLNLNKLYGTYSIPRIGQVLFIYIANIINEDFRAADETTEVKLFSVSKIPWEKIAFPSVEFFLKNYKKDFLNGRNFTFHSNFLDQ